MVALWIVAALAAAVALLAGWLFAGGWVLHAIGQVRGDKQSPQPARAYGAAILSELATLVQVLIRYPRGLLVGPPVPNHDPQAGPPILLVPGYGLVWTSLDRVAEILQDNGLENVHRLDRWPLTASIEDVGRRVAEEAARLAGEAGRSCLIVGYSLGGLAARWAIDHGAQPHVFHVVTVATPHAGTRRARLAPTPTSRQSRRDGAVVQALDPHPLVASTSVFSHVDNAIVPARSALWGDQAVAVPGTGHLGLAWRPRATRVILAAVAAAIAEPLTTENE